MQETPSGLPSLEFDFPLLENGFDFLASSLEHLTTASDDPTDGSRLAQIKNDEAKRRHLKYALLHACSAIELLFKERLRQEHWLLVFKDINKAKKDDYERGDFQSVTFQEAQDRLTKICEVGFSEEQIRQLKNFRDRRNQLEHFGAIDSLPAVMANVAQMVGFLMDFVQTAFLPEVLTDAEDMLSNVRAQLGDCNAFIKHRWQEIRSELDSLDTVTCPACQQSAAIIDDGTITCRFCNHADEAERMVTDYIERVLGFASQYSVEKDGEEWPLADCPECGNHTLITAMPGPDDTLEAKCFHCGDHWGGGDLATCSECGSNYSRSHDEIGICHSCLQYKVNKDD